MQSRNPSKGGYANIGLSGKRVHVHIYTYTRTWRTHTWKMRTWNTHTWNVHTWKTRTWKTCTWKTRTMFICNVETWRFYWKSSCRPSDCVNDGQIMTSVKDNFTVDYVMFSTFIVFHHASRKSSRISNHLVLLSHAHKIMPLLHEHWRCINHTFGNLAIQ